jgi:helix-turn-helix protein
MLLWDGSENELVKLCVAFRKAVVAEFEKKPELQEQVLGAYTETELKEFQYWAAEAKAEADELKAQLAAYEMGNAGIEAQLDRIVLDMSEKSTEVALRVLGEETLKGFIEDPRGRTQEVSDEFAQRKCPNLARIFRP